MKKLSPYMIPGLLAAAVLFTGIFVTARFDLYYRFSEFDKLLHTLGGIAVTWLFILAYKKELTVMPFFKQYFLILGGFSLVAVFWEFAEYASGVLTRTAAPLIYRYFHGGDMNDTIGDLAIGLLAATLVAIVWSLLQRRTARQK